MGCHEMLPLTDLVNQERLFLSQIQLPQKKKEPESIFAIVDQWTVVSQGSLNIFQLSNI